MTVYNQSELHVELWRQPPGRRQFQSHRDVNLRRRSFGFGYGAT